jgi:CheY-like chemotaxis protein
VTHRDEPDERDRSLTAGFDTHLVKPVSPNRMTQTLRQLLAHWHVGAGRGQIPAV